MPIEPAPMIPAPDPEPHYQAFKRQRAEANLARLKQIEDDEIYQAELLEVQREAKRLERIAAGLCRKRTSKKRPNNTESPSPHTSAVEGSHIEDGRTDT